MSNSTKLFLLRIPHVLSVALKKIEMANFFNHRKIDS